MVKVAFFVLCSACLIQYLLHNNVFLHHTGIAGNSTLCAPGSYGLLGATSAAMATIAVCSPCPPGTYSSTAGSGECTPCSAGTYSMTSGATSSATCTSKLRCRIYTYIPSILRAVWFYLSFASSASHLINWFIKRCLSILLQV